MGDEIKCTDCNEELKLWNYEFCDNESSDEIKKNRGLVKTDDGRLVCPSFGYTEEYSAGDENVEIIKENWRWFYSCEGTLLRLFHHNNHWYLCTHKKLDAYKSRWSCKFTFGELFEEYMEEILQTGAKSDILHYLTARLNPFYKYCFLLKSNYQNRIVVQSHYHPRKNRILYVGYWDENNEFILGENDSVNEVLKNIPTPIPYDRTENLKEYVLQMNYFQYQGLIGFDLPNHKTVKILHPKYIELYQIRGNNPNLRFRYLELRNDPEKLRLLYFLYPKQSELFDDYEDCLFNIARMIYKFYVTRYIKNKYITLPREEYGIMKKSHEWYLSNRQDNRIFTKKILEFMNDETPLNLYKMIRRYHIQKVNEGVDAMMIPPSLSYDKDSILFPDNKALHQLVFSPQLTTFE